MEIINDTMVAVSSFLELKNVLEGINNYNYIYFENDINLEAGIKISSIKINVTLDGTYKNVRHKFSDKKTLNASDTISVQSANTLKINVCNMDIIGNNYYGIIYVAENNVFSNINVIYSNITYEGPQLSFHPTGITSIIDSKITIIDTSLTVGNEVCECNKIILGGNTSIIHNSKSNSAFWFRNSNPSLMVNANSTINFTSVYRELIYGTDKLIFTIQENAKFNIITYNGLSYGTFGTSETNIYNNSTLHIKKTAYNGSYATWYSYGKISVFENVSLCVINDFTTTSGANYNIYFTNSSGGLYFKNPLEIIFYNTSSNIIYAGNKIPFEFQFTRINLFTKSIPMQAAISKDNMPSFAWYKETELITINGTFNSTTTTITSHSLSEADLITLPELTNFVFPNKKSLSIGTIKLHIDGLTDEDTVMNGVTDDNATLLISYNDSNIEIEANQDGTFTYSYNSPLPVGTNIIVNVKKSDEIIYRTKTITIQYPGELIIENATSLITFEMNPISLSPLLCPKKESLKIVVRDSRINSKTWNLYATVKDSNAKSNEFDINDSIVFRDENEVIHFLSETKMLVYSGLPNDGTTKETEINWSNNEGILLNIKKPLVNKKTYRTTIKWSIE